MADEVTIERVINAPADELWARVSDMDHMGDLSPEYVGCTWMRGPSGAVVGARFRGRNQNGKRQWSTESTITDVEPGLLFAFDVKAGPWKVARWVYRFEPTDGGCRVTETWIDQRGWLAKTLGKPVSGVGDRATHNRSTMEATLNRLAALSES